MDNYIWTGLFPLALIMTFSKSPRLKALNYPCITSYFIQYWRANFNLWYSNYDEPVLMIPFVLSYVMLAVISVTLTSFGILPTPVLSVPWIMPAPIKTFLATNASI